MIKINMYKDSGTWFGARWIDGEYDGDGPVVEPAVGEVVGSGCAVPEEVDV